MKLLLILGAVLFASAAMADDGWRSMDSAPRDGTVIEIQNNYGRAPWYGIYHYGGKIKLKGCSSAPVENRDGFNANYLVGIEMDIGTTCANPIIVEIVAGDRWVSENQIGSSLSPSDESRFKWRPYRGSENYADPTQGAQGTTDYWLRGLRP